jgi:hypothetical protein
MPVGRDVSRDRERRALRAGKRRPRGGIDIDELLAGVVRGDVQVRWEFEQRRHNRHAEDRGQGDQDRAGDKHSPPPS